MSWKFLGMKWVSHQIAFGHEQWLLLVGEARPVAVDIFAAVVVVVASVADLRVAVDVAHLASERIDLPHWEMIVPLLVERLAGGW
jgi:hypothetical protein